MDNNNFGRPVIFDIEDMAIAFLQVFEFVSEELKAIKRCNQYDVATELKRIFLEAKHTNPLSLQAHLVNQETLKRRIDLCEYLDISYSLWAGFYFYSSEYEQLESYILDASPDAIVQMKKRIKRANV